MIHVRAKRDVPEFRLRTGEDSSVTGEVAKILKDQDMVWIVGGDGPDFEAYSLSCDAEVGPSVVYKTIESGDAVVVKGN